MNNGKQGEQLLKVLGGHSASLDRTKCRGLSEQPNYTRVATKPCNMKKYVSGNKRESRILPNSSPGRFLTELSPNELSSKMFPWG